jgi:glucose dehydrogenase
MTNTSKWLAAALFGSALVLPGVTAANADLEKLIADPNNWAMQAGDMYNQRYSKLSQINAQNVGKMQVAWMFSTGVLRGHEGIAAGGERHDVRALRRFPTRCSPLIWKRKRSNGATSQAGCGRDSPDVLRHVYRGVAYAENKIFLQQADSTLLALDANTGKVIWS